MADNEFRVSHGSPGSALLVGVMRVFNVGGTFCQFKKSAQNVPCDCGR